MSLPPSSAPTATAWSDGGGRLYVSGWRPRVCSRESGRPPGATRVDAVFRAQEEDLCPGGPAIDGCPVGSLRRRAPVQAKVGIAGAPARLGREEDRIGAGVVRGYRLGFAETSSMRARCRREGARRTGVRARRCWADANGRLAIGACDERRGRSRRGGRDATRAGSREPDGARLRRPLDQPEATRPLPRSHLAGGCEGRPAGRTSAGLGTAYRPALSSTAGAD